MADVAGPLSSPTVTAVVPVLNEAKRLPALLRRLTTLGCEQIVVSDGGSDDGSVALAKSLGAQVVCGAAGRGPQLNRGARLATQQVLWFVHADVMPPLDAREQISAALQAPTVVGGAFQIRTVSGDGPWRLGRALKVVDMRSRYTSYPYGDQGIFVRREIFERVGGFDPIPVMEEFSLVRSLWRHGRLVRLPGPLAVSGRRFEHRPLYYTGVMVLFPVLFRLGVSAETLARLYAHER